MGHELGQEPCIVIQCQAVCNIVGHELGKEPCIVIHYHAV